MSFCAAAILTFWKLETPKIYNCGALVLETGVSAVGVERRASSDPHGSGWVCSGIARMGFSH